MLLKSIQSTLEKFNVNSVLVGFSGGVDSTVLLSLLNKIPNLNVRAVYVNHNVSDNSHDWEVFCRDFCKKLNIEFHVKSVDCSKKSRESFEAVARTKRYESYKELLQDGEHLCLGQHSDDQVETVLLQLLRGTGLAGLSGMALCDTFNNGFILRPFLDTDKLTITKEVIEEYSTNNKIEHITDESNFSNDYRRNFLRNKIIPDLKEEFGNINKAVTRTASHCAEANSYINEKMVSIEENSFDIKVMNEFTDFELKSSIQKWVKNNGKLALSSKNLVQLSFFIKNYKTDSNFKLTTTHYDIRHYNKKIYILEKEQEVNFSINNKGNKIPFIKNSTLLKREDIKYPLFFEGKLFNLKRYFNSLKLPIWERKNIPIYLFNDNIIAIGNDLISKDFSSEEYFDFIKN